MQREDKGVTIRQPATANLQVDSDDRNTAVYKSPFDFYITQPQNLLNGFFTRIGMTESQLNWDVANIQEGLDNKTLTFDFANFSTLTGGTQSTIGVAPISTISLTSQNYFVGTASNFFSTTVGRMNPLLSSLSTVMSFDLSGSVWNLQTANVGPALPAGVSIGFRTEPTNLAYQASIYPSNNYTNSYEIVNPDFRPFKYIDFVSNKLTNNQDLKDSSTNPYKVDVLQRWFFADDNTTPVDGCGFPIRQGYSPFTVRRLFNPPKQIKWEPEQPVGQIDFSVWGIPCPQNPNSKYQQLSQIQNSNGSTLRYYDTDYQFTLQASEN